MKLTHTLLSCLLLVCLTNCTNKQTEETKCILNVASYNLRMDTSNDGDNAWPHRKEMVKDLISFHDFDVFGTQEAFHHMLQEVATLDAYTYVGVGREDGKTAGEHSAIFYKKDRFNLLDNGDFWFSETPDIPSKGWDAECCERLCSWVKLQDKASGIEFFVFNSHYDHEGQIARKQSSEMLLKYVKDIAKDAPTFATGDYNATPKSEPIQTLLSDGLLKDAYDISKTNPYGTIGTFQGFKIESKMTGRIDYIFVSKGIEIEKYGTLNDMPYGKFPSDHFPVMVKAEIIGEQ